MQPVPGLLEKCRKRGVKLTPQRIAVFECLAAHRGHLAADEVYQEVLLRYPTLSFATVYNTLELLTELGEVRAIIVDELRRRYDVNTEPHHHAVCRRCHRILDVEPEVAGEAWAGLSGRELPGLDFRVEAASVEFTGLCGSCARPAE